MYKCVIPTERHNLEYTHRKALRVNSPVMFLTVFSPPVCYSPQYEYKVVQEKTHQD